MYTKPNAEDPMQADSNATNIKNATLLHHGRICTFVSILTYMVAGVFIIVQEIHEAPWIVDHMVYIFLILSYTFMFVAVRNVGMEYFPRFVRAYCGQHQINQQKREEFERFFRGIYNAYGAFSVIYWFGYLLAICTNKNNFIVTAIGLGHIYLAAITLLHGGMLHSMKIHKDEDSQSSRLLDNDQIDENEARNNSKHTMLQSIDVDEEDEEDEQQPEQKKEENEDLVVAGDEIANGNEFNNAVGPQSIGEKWAALPLISKWVVVFVILGMLLIFEGILYAAAYSQNTGDFEFPEVHPFFLFTIFLFFAVLHVWVCKYAWID